VLEHLLRSWSLDIDVVVSAAVDNSDVEDQVEDTVTDEQVDDDTPAQTDQTDEIRPGISDSAEIELDDGQSNSAQNGQTAASSARVTDAIGTEVDDDQHGLTNEIIAGPSDDTEDAVQADCYVTELPDNTPAQTDQTDEVLAGISDSVESELDAGQSNSAQNGQTAETSAGIADAVATQLHDDQHGLTDDISAGLSDEIEERESHNAQNDQAAETSAGPSVMPGLLRIIRRNDGEEVNARGMVYPVARKTRGRPKGTGKTLNRLYRKKRTKTVAPSRSEANAENNCSGCGHGTPPGNANKRRKRMVDWVQCDACDVWYHLRCTSLTVLPAPNKAFVCVRCS